MKTIIILIFLWLPLFCYGEDYRSYKIFVGGGIIEDCDYDPVSDQVICTTYTAADKVYNHDLIFKYTGDKVTLAWDEDADAGPNSYYQLRMFNTFDGSMIPIDQNIIGARHEFVLPYPGVWYYEVRACNPDLLPSIVESIAMRFGGTTGVGAQRLDNDGEWLAGEINGLHVCSSWVRSVDKQTKYHENGWWVQTILKPPTGGGVEK